MDILCPCGQPAKVKFCSKSCAAKHNNGKRTRSCESKAKTAKALTGLKRAYKWGGTCKVAYRTCKICSSTFCTSTYNSRKTCSEACTVHAKVKIRTYQNGSRKPTEYTSELTGQTVWLESSWEVRVAEFLDSNHIIWTRPAPVGWVDYSGKNRMYYPDFYLPEQDVYLDPKNPYCMKLDEEKISKVSKLINLKVGSLELVLDYLKSLG